MPIRNRIREKNNVNAFRSKNSLNGFDLIQNKNNKTKSSIELRETIFSNIEKDYLEGILEGAPKVRVKAFLKMLLVLNPSPQNASNFINEISKAAGSGHAVGDVINEVGPKRFLSFVYSVNSPKAVGEKLRELGSTKLSNILKLEKDNRRCWAILNSVRRKSKKETKLMLKYM